MHNTIKLLVHIYLSAAKAAKVNTDTPMEISLAYSDILQIVVPHGHDSTV